MDGKAIKQSNPGWRETEKQIRTIFPRGNNCCYPWIFVLTRGGIIRIRIDEDCSSKLHKKITWTETKACSFPRVERARFQAMNELFDEIPRLFLHVLRERAFRVYSSSPMMKLNPILSISLPISFLPRGADASKPSSVSSLRFYSLCRGKKQRSKWKILTGWLPCEKLTDFRDLLLRTRTHHYTALLQRN